jgi:hypothetical protein
MGISKPTLYSYLAEAVARRLPAEAVMTLRRRLEPLTPRDPERSRLLADTARLYGVSRAALYRQLREQGRPRALHRADRGRPRVLPLAALQRYCELIAALKLRTTNGKGRHLSTRRAIALLEEQSEPVPHPRGGEGGDLRVRRDAMGRLGDRVN